MNKQLATAAALTLALVAWTTYGDEGHEHGATEPAEETEEGMMHGDHGHTDEDAHHRHDEWINPPEAYADKVSDKWADADAIARGEEIYNEQCVSCHGANGRGTGPIAQSLSHPPADLTNNFHTSPGNGDAYLFWRVSEGGTVEPFKSQGSSMPAFKNVLTPADRWDVLAYVHTFFHQGLAEWNGSGTADSNGGDGDGGS